MVLVQYQVKGIYDPHSFGLDESRPLGECTINGELGQIITGTATVTGID